MVFLSTWIFSALPKKWTWKPQQEIELSTESTDPHVIVSGNDQSESSRDLTDLTLSVGKESTYAIAQGGFGDIWKCRFLDKDHNAEEAVKCARIEIPDAHFKEIVNMVDDYIPSGRHSTSVTEHSSALCIKSDDIIKQTNYPTASGGFGDVYRCTWNSGASSDEVAVKSSRFPNLRHIEVVKINKNLDREIHIWAALKHQYVYVLPLHGTVEEFGPFRALVSPWMPNGTLDSYLNAHEALSMMGRLRLLEQITEGLQYLHDQNVIHGDLTSNNILIAADGSPRLADFGISNIMVQYNPAFSYHTGAVRWVAPELLNPPEDQTIQCATRSTDIYALGGIMLQVLYGKEPYWWLENTMQVVSAKFKHLEPIDPSVEIQPNHLDFMQRCWSMKIEIRPSVEEVINYLQKALSNETSAVRGLGPDTILFLDFMLTSVVCPIIYHVVLCIFSLPCFSIL